MVFAQKWVMHIFIDQSQHLILLISVNELDHNVVLEGFDIEMCLPSSR